MTERVTLVVPAYNESGNLGQTVERTTTVLRDRATDWTFEILLVVSGGSDDGTQELAAELDDRHPEVSRLVRTSDFGFGNALKDGLADADGDILVPFMADLSDDPKDVPKLVSRIRDGYDIVYGSRFADGGSVEGYPLLKLCYNRACNNFIRVLFGIGERDVTNAFTAYRSEVIDDIGTETLRSESFGLTAELPLRATVEGYRITEVPVSWRSRESGVSKLNATQKGPVYVQRVLAEFVRGNAAGLRDLFAAVTDQGWRRVVVAALFGLLLLVGLFSLSGFDEVFDLVGQADLRFVFAAGVTYGVSFIFRTWRWRVLLRASGHLASRANTFRCIMGGWLLNSMIPARAGDVFRGYSLKTTDGVPFGVGIGTIVIERALDMLVLAAGMGVVTALYLRSDRAAYLTAGAFAIGAGLFTVLVGVAVFGHMVPDWLEARVAGLTESVRAVQRALRRVRGNPFALALSVALSVPVWTAEILTLYLAARSLDVPLSGLVTVAAAVSGFVSQSIPVTPGGLGTYETAITSMLVLFGVEASTGTALALVDHVTRLGVIYIVGTVAIVHIVFQSRPYFKGRLNDDDEPDIAGENPSADVELGGDR